MSLPDKGRQPDDRAEWVLLDTETDGLYSPIHVVEIAATRMHGLSPLGTPFQVFLNHNVPIPPEAFAVHGYSEEFLREHGVAPHEAYERLRAYIEDRPVASHYLSFDWNRTLVPEWSRLSIPTMGHKGMCTWSLSRRVIHETPSHRLDALRNHFELKCHRAHSASGDVESLVDLWERVLLPRLRNVGITSYEQILDFSMMRPIARCLCLIQGRNYEEVVRESNRARNVVRQLESGQFRDIPSAILEHDLIAENPEIEFDNKVFLFTGKMKWGLRSQAEAMIQRLGGKAAPSKSVTDTVDYLVLGEDMEKGWTSLVGGGKLTSAFQRRLLNPNGRLKIILETDFISEANRRIET